MSDERHNGGPAFPQNTFEKVGEVAVGQCIPGMTLRDYFAAHALQGLIASDVYIKELDEASKRLGMTGEEEQQVQPKVVSNTAYLGDCPLFDSCTPYGIAYPPKSWRAIWRIGGFGNGLLTALRLLRQSYSQLYRGSKT